MRSLESREVTCTASLSVLGGISIYRYIFLFLFVLLFHLQHAKHKDLSCICLVTNQDTVAGEHEGFYRQVGQDPAAGGVFSKAKCLLSLLSFKLANLVTINTNRYLLNGLATGSGRGE